MLNAWKVPKRPVEMSCDVMPNLAAYQTDVETQTHSSGMRAALTVAWYAYTSFCLSLVRSV